MLRRQIPNIYRLQILQIADLKFQSPPHLAVSSDASVLDGGEAEPGGAVAEGEHPAHRDDPLGPAQGADVLKCSVQC